MGWSVLRTYSIQYTYGYIYILLEETRVGLNLLAVFITLRKGGTFVGNCVLCIFRGREDGIYVFVHEEPRR